MVVGTALDLIDNHYVEPVDDRSLIEGAMKGLTSSLDPYSQFVSLDDYEGLKTAMDQQFAGIGIYVSRPDADGPVRVVTPLVGSPALAAGMRAGDRIVAVDGEDVSRADQGEVSSRLKGPIGTSVNITVRREDDDGQTVTRDLRVRRATINLEYVVGVRRGPDNGWTYRLENHPDIAYVRVMQFGERTVDELRSVIEKLLAQSQTLSGLILDLRANGGGLLPSAVDVADLFLDTDGPLKGLVVSTRDRGGDINEQLFVGDDVLYPAELPLVVLVDHNSASASEIVAAALQDHGRATIVGTRSFGKGSVQSVLPLEAGRSALKLTVARFFRPAGGNIHRGPDMTDDDTWGVTPEPRHLLELDEQQMAALVNRWQLSPFPYGTSPTDVVDPDDPDVVAPADPSVPLTQVDPHVSLAVSAVGVEALAGPSGIPTD